MDRIEKTSDKIILDVATNGDRALIKYTKKFDKIELAPDQIEVNSEERKAQADGVAPEIYSILEQAADNIKKYAQEQDIYKKTEFDNNGIKVVDRYIPLQKVGIYVPGGNYSYPSTVLMCAIPAKVAGVREIIMVTPPGKLTPEVLAAARIAGVNRVFRVGGAQAIAALAYGTETVPNVDKIVGPGNAYIQTAKMFVMNRVGIDMLAGPSEVVIIADEAQNPKWIATDLMAQAEHAMDASGIMITPSEKLINEVRAEIPQDIGDRIKFLKVSDLNEAMDKSNEIAPEHLQIMCSDNKAAELAERVVNSGAVFLGKDTPVAIGDYWAGPSHTLPTGKAAVFQEGLNVRSFLKKVSFIKCSAEGMKGAASSIARFAEQEGMKYHAESVKMRDEE